MYVLAGEVKRMDPIEINHSLAFLLLTLTVRTGSPPTGRQKVQPARTSWLLLLFGDFSVVLLQ
jgi:hypothetical protein